MLRGCCAAGGGHEFTLGLRVLAPLSRNADQLHARHARQSFANLQTGGSGFAVDENFGHETSRKNGNRAKKQTPSERFGQGLDTQARVSCAKPLEQVPMIQFCAAATGSAAPTWEGVCALQSAAMRSLSAVSTDSVKVLS